jgi:hypothetical protein
VGELEKYFVKPQVRKALDRFALVSQARKWDVQWEIGLYEKSVAAFGNAQRFDYDAFESIFQALRSHWQVFRPAREGCWSAEQVFKALTTDCAEAALGGNVSMFTAKPALVRRCASALKGIKPNQGFPTMAVSKFLHFFNPSLFPIYDGAVIGNTVLVRFRNDYEAFCTREALNRNAEGPGFLSNYYQWAADLLKPSREDVMRIFREWAEDHLKAKAPPITDKLFARAFEAIAIGAAS